LKLIGIHAAILIDFAVSPFNLMTQPSRLTFWRLLLGISVPLAGFALWEAFVLAGSLGLAPLASKTWLLSLGALAGFALLNFSLLALTWTAWREKVLSVLEFADQCRPLGLTRFFGLLLLLAALAAYPVIMLHPYYGNLLAKQAFLRLFLFWVLAGLGTQALKLGGRQQITWFNAFLLTLLFQTAVYQVALYLPNISAYPFAMGWSETSRFYYPSLFLSRTIYGQAFPWPILHPSLHLTLTLPYWFDAPLWFHRFWQVFVRFLLVGLSAPALVYRLKIASRPWRWLVGLWVFIYLFTLPLYLHLAVPVFIMLWGFSAHNERRTWVWLIVASIWAGLSRLNWYPMPGLLAAVLYLLETSPKGLGKSLVVYLVKPAQWFIIGTTIAFLTMRGYIALSGIPNAGNFYTSLSSTLLWARLWPNASYALGVLPGIALFSLPMWLAGLQSLRVVPLKSQEALQSRLRLGLILAALAVLFVGGIFVSMKIGGGADLHNMDAYAVLLLIVTAYLVFGRFTPEAGQTPRLRTLPWGWVALLVLVPAWLNLRGTASFWQYAAANSQATLTALQQKVDSVNAQGGQILFITQRHLIAMKMLKNVTLIPEYEREELMEMAMANNDAYLKTFRADLEQHRFAAIVVDPLKFNLVGEEDAMGAENNAWTRAVVKKVLCNYKLDELFAADRIAIYIPQAGPQQCP
jgi:hypothetical protein